MTETLHLECRPVTIRRPQPTDPAITIYRPVETISGFNEKRVVVEVRYNGEVIFGEGVTPTEAAKVFWNQIAGFAEARFRQFEEACPKV